MKRKMLVAIDTKEAMAEWPTGSQKPVIDQLAEKYDLDVTVMIDEAFMRGLDERRHAVHRVERNGAEFAEYSPEYLEAIKDAEILVVNFAPVSSKLIAAAPKLKVVGVMRSGLENVNVEACKEAGVIVCNAPGRLMETVSDLTCALILSANRGVTYFNTQYSPETGDPKLYFKAPLFKDITLGIVGFGYIGQLVARKLSGFNMKMIAYDPFVPQEVADKYNVTLVDLPTLMKESDTITIHSRLLPATEKMISAEMISLMKPSAFFVNTARAGLEDEEALIKALQERKIRGAALDVTMVEPVPADHPLRKLDNVVLTPHVAGQAGDGKLISAQLICGQLTQYLDGEKPSTAR